MFEDLAEANRDNAALMKYLCRNLDQIQHESRPRYPRRRPLSVGDSDTRARSKSTGSDHDERSDIDEEPSRANEANPILDYGPGSAGEEHDSGRSHARTWFEERSSMAILEVVKAKTGDKKRHSAGHEKKKRPSVALLNSIQQV